MFLAPTDEEGIVATSIVLLLRVLAMKWKPEDSCAWSQYGHEGKHNEKKNSEKKWYTVTGRLLPYPSFTAQTVETPNTAIKPAKLMNF